MDDGTCLDCGSPVTKTARGPFPRRCVSCKVEFKRLRQAELKRHKNAQPKLFTLVRYSDCIECGRLFVQPVRTWRKVCTRTCRNRRNRHQADPAKRKAQREKARPKVTRSCRYCGLQFETIVASKVSTGGRWYCNAEHFRLAMRQARSATPCRSCGAPASKAAPYCGAACERKHKRWTDALRRGERAALGTSNPMPWHCGNCLLCGDYFVTWFPQGSYCSAGCTTRAAKDRRRARKRAAFVAPVNRAAIFERDAWTCQLCGFPVVADAVVPDFEAPVIDHVVPLARGGTHEPSNVQCAHFLCNSYKSDRVA